MNKLTEALFNNQLPADLAASQRLNRQLLDLMAQLEQRVGELEDKAGSGRLFRANSKNAGTGMSGHLSSSGFLPMY